MSQQTMSAPTNSPKDQTTGFSGRLRTLMADSPILILVVVLVILILITGAVQPSYLSVAGLRNTLLQAAPLGILAGAQTILLLTGGIDLSATMIATAAAYVAANQSPHGAFIAMVWCLVVGLIIGSANGVGATSFFPSKPLGCYGDGGALFTDDDAVAQLMREIRVHGQDRRYHHPRLGLTGRLDSIQAAVLLAKTEIFDDEVAARARVAATYERLIVEAFGRDGVVRAPYVEPHNTSVYAQYTIEVDRREIVETRMKAAGVPTAVHYPIALHEQPVFEGLGHALGEFPVSEAAARRVISLPMHPYLVEEQQARVVAAVKEAVSG